MAKDKIAKKDKVIIAQMISQIDHLNCRWHLNFSGEELGLIRAALRIMWESGQ